MCIKSFLYLEMKIFIYIRKIKLNHKKLNLIISKLIKDDIKQISMIDEDKEINSSNDDKTLDIILHLII